MSANRDDFTIAIRYALLKKGTREKFSLFFFICLSVAIFFLDSYPNKFMNSSRSLINDTLYRASLVASSPFKLISSLEDLIKTHFLIYNENKDLKNELEVLRSKKFNEDFLNSQYENLIKALDNQSQNSYSNVAAKVLLDKKSPYLKSLIINRGSNSGITKGMPVLDRNYLVGQIVEVNYFSSRVLLLNDLNSRIPVMIEKTSTQAILSGKGTDTPVLEYLPEASIIEEEITVFTSGKDGIFTQGIPVGVVKNDNNLVNVKLFSDSNQLTFITVNILDDRIKD
jgi:rod shape-determining protein MreC